MILLAILAFTASAVPMILLTILVIAPAVLGVLVFSHELGHFIAARSVGIQVLTFSIGFGPKFLRLRRGETEYALSWIPFGGYVKMAGEMEGDDETDVPIRPGARFSDKSVPARAWVVIAGPLANYVLALAIFIGFFAMVGEDVIGTNVVGEVVAESPAAKVGIEPGDELMSLGGQAVADWSDLARAVDELPAGETPLVYLHGGEERTATLQLPEKTAGENRIGVYPLRPAIVGTVKRGAAADRAGLKSGDLVIEAGGQPVQSWDALAGIIHDAAGKELAFRLVRAGETLGGSVIPEEGSVVVSETESRKVGLIGITPPMERRVLSPVRAIEEGWDQTNWWCGQVAQFVPKLIQRKISKDMVGGPLRIGELAGEAFRWGFSSLVTFLAVLSVHLAVLNLLPIPIFDGGQLVLLLAEAIMQRPLSQRFRLVLQQIGFGLVVLLMAVVTLLDVGRWIGR